MSRFSVVPIMDGVGVTVMGDILAPFSADDLSDLRDLLYRHFLLVFPRQVGLTRDRQNELMDAFDGKVILDDGKYDTEAITNVDRTRGVQDDDKGNSLKHSVLAWHSDNEFLSCSYEVNALYAVDVVDGATATDFANGARAYTKVSPEVRERVAGRDALHVYRHDYTRRNRARDVPADHPRFASPVLDVHRQSGTPFVSVSEMFIDSISGLEEEESEALIATLRAELEHEDNYYRHIWNNGDLVVWENRVVQHRRPNDVKPGEIGTRVLRRSQVGEVTATELMEKWYADYKSAAA